MSRRQSSARMGVAAGRRENQRRVGRRAMVEIVSRPGIGLAHRARRGVKPKSSRGLRAGAAGAVRAGDRQGRFLADPRRQRLLRGTATAPPDLFPFRRACRWRRTCIRPALTQRGNWMFLAARAAPWRPPARNWPRPNLAGAICLLTVYGEVARNYVQARAFQRRLSVLRENIKAQQDILALTRDLFAKGLTTDLDVQQGESLLATTQSQNRRLKPGSGPAPIAWPSCWASRPARCWRNCPASAPVPAAPPAVPVGLPSDLIHRRPDIQQAERQLAAATARIGVAKADLFPQFSLTGDVGLESIYASDWFTAGSRYWTAGPMAQWRIFRRRAHPRQHPPANRAPGGGAGRLRASRAGRL